MRSPTGPGSDTPSGPTVLPERMVPSARPEGGAKAGTPAPPSGLHFCWQCGRFAVDAPGDFCDLCLDDIAAELEALAGPAW